MTDAKEKKGKILIICGPTASGKSAVAVECAKILKSEIISADALDVYKGLNVGTAKPTEEEKQGIKHHLIDVVDAHATFSVGDYRELAKPIIDALIEDCKIPIVCGGAGFYINSVIYDLSFGNSPSNVLAREKYMEMARREGKEKVYSVLLEKDPISAKTLHPNDLKRVVRALEIYESGYKKSDIIDDMIPVYDYRAFAIDIEREELYRRIDDRVDEMISRGLVDEVKSLVKSGITLNNQCMQAIGYKEIYAYLCGETTLDSAISSIKLNTRHYAKRQLTFFKRLKGLTFLKPDSPDKLAKKIVESLW